MNIKNFYFNLSLKYKILILFYSVIMIISVILGLYSYYTSKNYIVDKVSASNLEVARQIDNNLDYIQKDVFDASTVISISNDIQSVLRQSDSGSGTTGGTYIPNDAGHYFDSYSVVSNLVSNSLVYTNAGQLRYVYNSDGSIVNNVASGEAEKSIFSKAQTSGSLSFCFLIDKNNPAFLGRTIGTKIAFARVIRDTGNYQPLGYIISCVPESTVMRIYSQNILTDKESILITDSDGNILTGEGPLSTENDGYLQTVYGKFTASEGFFISESNAAGQTLVAYCKENMMGWAVVYTMPLDTLSQQIQSTMIFTIGVIVICLVLSLPVVLLISSFLTAPIMRLFNSMKRFQTGSFEERVEVKYNDEIGKLGAGYNDMVSNIKDLIDKTYILQIKEREAELNTLQAQINPHFLYNMLDTIFWEAEKNGQHKISDMIFSLSRLFRLSLNSGKKFTNVASEKELVENYLKLQKMRFQNKLIYTIEINDKILNFLIPKLILQPFVENAIIHGLEDKSSAGLLEIQGYQEEEQLVFLIKDNGVGMDEDTLSNLLDPKVDDGSEPANRGGFAIKNVNDRLKLTFRDKYSLKFNSMMGAGTQVEIRIPAVRDPKDMESLPC